MVKVGDKVKVQYISDCNANNGKVGTVISERMNKFYPNGDPNEFVWKQSCIIQYLDGSTHTFYDTERMGSGLVSPLIKVAI